MKPTVKRILGLLLIWVVAFALAILTTSCSGCSQSGRRAKERAYAKHQGDLKALRESTVNLDSLRAEYIRVFGEPPTLTSPKSKSLFIEVIDNCEYVLNRSNHHQVHHFACPNVINHTQ